MRLKTLAAIAAVTALPLIAYADAAEDALEARQGYMKMLAINMGALSGMAKGEIEYNEVAASTAAANIEAISGYDITGIFPEGTSVDDIDDTEALPTIWENPEDFAKKYAAVAEASAGAGEAVKGGQANLAPVLQKLGGACKACHDDYRQKD